MVETAAAGLEMILLSSGVCNDTGSIIVALQVIPAVYDDIVFNLNYTLFLENTRRGKTLAVPEL